MSRLREPRRLKEKTSGRGAVPSGAYSSPCVPMCSLGNDCELFNRLPADSSVP